MVFIKETAIPIKSTILINYVLHVCGLDLRMNIITDDKSIAKQIIKTFRKCRGKKKLCIKLQPFILRLILMF